MKRSDFYSSPERSAEDGLEFIRTFLITACQAGLAKLTKVQRAKVRLAEKLLASVVKDHA